MKAMGVKSKGLAMTQTVREVGKPLSLWRGKRLSLRWVRTVLMGRLMVALLMTFGSACLSPFPMWIGMATTWSQEGYFTYEVEERGVNEYREEFCGVPPLEVRELIRYRGRGTSWGTRLAANSGWARRNSLVKFIIYWHGAQAPSDSFVALSYWETALLDVKVPPEVGEATARFRGNILSESVSLRAPCEPSFPGWVCEAGRYIYDGEIHPYWLNFSRVSEGLWKAELSIPFNVEATIQGTCPPPPLPTTSGYIEAYSSVGITEPKFVYIVAANEPSYHKKDNCVRVMNNTSGRLDDRYGDTVIELYGWRGKVPNELGFPSYLYTDWYLGNRMTYTRQLFGSWCPGDCPLNEWWICGVYYKDNLFHEFTNVNAVIGFPGSDCEDWYIGSEDGWNDEPSEQFWQREDVQRRVAEILDKLPFKYVVNLKVTDDYGNGFSDRAKYTMMVHAPLELTELVDIYDTFLPEEGRSHRHEFIPSEAFGAVRLSEWLNNYSSEPVTRSVTIEREDSFSSSLSGSIECSASGERNIPQIGKTLIGAKMGIGVTISTSSRYRIGMTIEITAPPHKRTALFSQRAATIEVWDADIYKWHGYEGTSRLKLQKDIRFEYVYWEEDLP